MTSHQPQKTNSATLPYLKSGTADAFPQRLLHESDASLAERVDSWHQRNARALTQKSNLKSRSATVESDPYLEGIKQRWPSEQQSAPDGQQAAVAGLVALETQTALLPEFQARVQPWMLACFGAEIANDAQERNHRFLEEAIELVQACGATASEAHQLVDYVYGRPVGEVPQEIGGVMVTLAALCLAQGENMHVAGETELARIWTKIDAVRAKQAAKPKHSPLPEHPANKKHPQSDTNAEILKLHTEMAGLRLALEQANDRVATVTRLSNHLQDQVLMLERDPAHATTIDCREQEPSA